MKQSEALWVAPVCPETVWSCSSRQRQAQASHIRSTPESTDVEILRLRGLRISCFCCKITFTVQYAKQYPNEMRFFFFFFWCLTALCPVKSANQVLATSKWFANVNAIHSVIWEKTIKSNVRKKTRRHCFGVDVLNCSHCFVSQVVGWETCSKRDLKSWVDF